MAIPDLPPSFAASSSHSTANAQSGHLMSHSSPSPSGVVRPSVPTLALEGLLGSDPHSAVLQQADAPAPAGATDQSAFQQRVSLSGPSRPQRTPIPDPGRGASSQAPDEPPGCSTLPVPQSTGSLLVEGYPHPPSSSSSSAYMSSQMHSQHDWPQSHQASRYCACNCSGFREQKIRCASDLTFELAVACDIMGRASILQSAISSTVVHICLMDNGCCILSPLGCPGLHDKQSHGCTISLKLYDASGQLHTSAFAPSTS